MSLSFFLIHTFWCFFRFILWFVFWFILRFILWFVFWFVFWLILRFVLITFNIICYLFSQSIKLILCCFCIHNHFDNAFSFLIFSKTNFPSWFKRVCFYQEHLISLFFHFVIEILNLCSPSDIFCFSCFFHSKGNLSECVSCLRNNHVKISSFFNLFCQGIQEFVLTHCVPWSVHFFLTFAITNSSRSVFNRYFVTFSYFLFSIDCVFNLTRIVIFFFLIKEFPP